jgi:hypothetical protein
VPLPETPQLAALQTLDYALGQLSGTLASARVSGADVACISAAEASLGDSAAALAAGMDAERERVTLARAERAKTDKKSKKGKPKKK